MWLRPTHFCKAALQVLLPPIFNQSTSSSSQLRQQAPLLQPHCFGPPSSCCSALLRHTTASWKRTGSGTEAVQKSSKAQGINQLLEADTSSPAQLPSSPFPRHRVPFLRHRVSLAGLLKEEHSYDQSRAQQEEDAKQKCHVCLLHQTQHLKDTAVIDCTQIISAGKHIT